MCGIAGFLGFSATGGREAAEAVASAMANTLVHRGPDHGGVWVDAEAGVAFGHRRLSILDLSHEGRQPMVSRNGRYVVVFNGEIYNFRQLRSELEPYPFRGASDTEVALAAFERWGVRASLCRFNGMFAFAVWDRHERSMCLARDRIGEKPLYYAWAGSTFLFASELKAFHAHPAFNARIDRNSLALFLRYGYVPSPHSIYHEVRKLPPGTTLTVQPEIDGADTEPAAYWSMKAVAELSLCNPLHVDDAEAAERLESLICDSVKLRMVSDVPLGAFLSGGIDSSTVVALMQKHSPRPVKTFTIGFRERDFDEAGYAREVARHLGTEHTELYVTSREAMQVVHRLPSLYDEPFADSSQIPTYLVSRLARENVTVALSGDGGDEVFGGYTRYLWARRIWRTFGWMPVAMRSGLAGMLAGLTPEAWERTYRWLDPLLPQSLKHTHPAAKFQKLLEILRVPDADAMYLKLVSHWDDPASMVAGAHDQATLLTQREHWTNVPDLIHHLMFLDTVTYLPDDILVKLDRASMGASLESRVPLLDHRIVEFAWRLPLNMKVRDGQGKWLLRRVLHKYVPPGLVNRPKAGFGVPLHEWLRGPLRDWAEALLDAGRLRQEGFLDPLPIRRRWAEHLAGTQNWAYPLWNVLMFQAWLEQEREHRPEVSADLASAGAFS